MPGQYRLEIASTGRAGCQGSLCKAESIKIQKGELRMGVYVTIKDNQTWRWKHWGCVTGKQIEHVKEAIEGDLDLFDGFEDIPEEDQARVKKALDDGIVAAEDWRGEAEANVPGGTGYQTKETKKKLREEKKQKEKGEDEGADGQVPKPEDERLKEGSDKEEANAAESSKKTKASTKKAKPAKKQSAAEADDEVPEPSKQRISRAKKATTIKPEDADEDVASDENVSVPVKGKGRGRKPKAVKNEDVEEEDEVKEDEQVAATTKVGAKANKSARAKKEETPNGVQEEVPIKGRRARGRLQGPKATIEHSEDDEASEEPIGKSRRSKKAKTVETFDGINEEELPAKKQSKKRKSAADSEPPAETTSTRKSRRRNA